MSPAAEGAGWSVPVAEEVLLGTTGPAPVLDALEGLGCRLEGEDLPSPRITMPWTLFLRRLPVRVESDPALGRTRVSVLAGPMQAFAPQCLLLAAAAITLPAGLGRLVRGAAFQTWGLEVPPLVGGDLPRLVLALVLLVLALLELRGLERLRRGLRDALDQSWPLPDHDVEDLARVRWRYSWFLVAELLLVPLGLLVVPRGLGLFLVAIPAAAAALAWMAASDHPVLALRLDLLRRRLMGADLRELRVVHVVCFFVTVVGALILVDLHATPNRAALRRSLASTGTRVLDVLFADGYGDDLLHETGPALAIRNTSQVRKRLLSRTASNAGNGCAAAVWLAAPILFVLLANRVRGRTATLSFLGGTALARSVPARLALAGHLATGLLMGSVALAVGLAAVLLLLQGLTGVWPPLARLALPFAVVRDLFIARPEDVAGGFLVCLALLWFPALRILWGLGAALREEFRRSRVVGRALAASRDGHEELRSAWARHVPGVPFPRVVAYRISDLFTAAPEVRTRLFPPGQYIALPTWFAPGVFPDPREAVAALARVHRRYVASGRAVVHRLLCLLAFQDPDATLAWTTDADEERAADDAWVLRLMGEEAQALLPSLDLRVRLAAAMSDRLDLAEPVTARAAVPHVSARVERRLWDFLAPPPRRFVLDRVLPLALALAVVGAFHHGRDGLVAALRAPLAAAFTPVAGLAPDGELRDVAVEGESLYLLYRNRVEEVDLERVRRLIHLPPRCDNPSTVIPLADRSCFVGAIASGLWRVARPGKAAAGGCAGRSASVLDVAVGPGGMVAVATSSGLRGFSPADDYDRMHTLWRREGLACTRVRPFGPGYLVATSTGLFAVDAQGWERELLQGSHTALDARGERWISAWGPRWLEPDEIRVGGQPFPTVKLKRIVGGVCEDDSVDDLLVDPAGDDVYAVMSGYGEARSYVARLTGGKWTRLRGLGHGFHPRRVVRFAGRVLVAATSGLFAVEGDAVVRIRTPRALPAGPIEAVAGDRDGNLWVFADQTAWCGRRGRPGIVPKLTVAPLVVSRATGRPLFLASPTTAGVWFVSHATLWFTDAGDTFEDRPLPAQSGALPTAIAEAPGHRPLVLMSSGELLVDRGEGWTLLATIPMSPKDPADLSVDGDHVWCALPGSLVRVGLSDPSPVTWPTPRRDTSWRLLVTSTGRILMAGSTGHLFELDAPRGTWRPLGIVPGLVIDLVEGPSHTPLLATRSPAALWELIDDTLVPRCTPAQGIPADPSRILPDASGRLWCLARNVLWRGVDPAPTPAR